MAAIWRDKPDPGRQAKKSVFAEPPGSQRTMCLSIIIYAEEPGI